MLPGGSRRLYVLPLPAGWMMNPDVEHSRGGSWSLHCGARLCVLPFF
jgi:hypothetical protein